MCPSFTRQPKTGDLAALAMAGVFPHGRCFHLVEAALRPQNANSSWKLYRAELGLEVPNLGETRLYPLVAENLKMVGLETLAPQLLAAKRTALVQSEVILQAAADVNVTLQRHGISAIFTKGIALQVKEYRNPALRTFSDIDCCIRTRDIEAVVRIAEQEGWRNIKNAIPRNKQALKAHAEMTFQLPSGAMLDLHWVPRRVFSFQPELINSFFDTAETVTWREHKWNVPSANWLLLETIEHGVSANEVMPIRWVIDAVRLLENPNNVFDWRLIEKSVSCARLNLPLQ